jgi:hypothetical protein
MKQNKVEVLLGKSQGSLGEAIGVVAQAKELSLKMRHAIGHLGHGRE